jgi:helix-turn-helix protein
VSLLASLSPEAREELRSLVREVVREEQRARERENARREWLPSEEVAALLGTSANAVRIRLRRGWLPGDVARDGKRLLVRRSAVLDWLDRRAER